MSNSEIKDRHLRWMEEKPAYRAAYEARILSAEKRKKMHASVQNLLGHGIILPKMDVIAATVDEMTEVVSQLKRPRGKLFAVGNPLKRKDR